MCMIVVGKRIFPIVIRGVYNYALSSTTIFDKINGTPELPLPPPISMMPKWRVSALTVIALGKGDDCPFLFCPRL